MTDSPREAPDHDTTDMMQPPLVVTAGRPPHSASGFVVGDQRSDVMAPKRLELDRSVPVLLVRFGLNPLHHGTVGAIRSLGRLGTPVYSIVEDNFTPAARSRYLTGYFRWPTTGHEEPDELVERLIRIGSSIGERPIALPTDDEAAVLLAEHSGRLRQQFIMPSVPPGLPRNLATKSGLYALCAQHGIPTAASIRPGSVTDALSAGEMLGFPLVVKNDEPWVRLVSPGVMSTAIIRDESELRSLVQPWEAMPSVVMQRYLPREHATDWISHGYWGEGEDQHLIFTGRKVRSWPPHAGVTTRAYTCSNTELSRLTSELCRKVGFRGISDLDWRFDAISGRYNLVDFNPRLGAQFRLFETVDGLDVVRAMHLDLTGRKLTHSQQVDGRQYTVGNLDLPAAAVYYLSGERQPVFFNRNHRERAWWAADDPVPALLATVRSGAFGAMRLVAGKLGKSRLTA
jgi:D-aspartate ligase